jgi:hypothetical protein
MTEAELRAYADRIDETPSYRLGGRINVFEDEQEFRAMQRPKRRRRLVDVLLDLDEMAVRMRQSDRLAGI